MIVAKGCPGLGNPQHVLLRIAIIALVLTSFRVAAADRCPPAVVLAGEPEVIATIADLLATHGIALETGACGVVEARVDRRGEELVIVLEQTDGTRVERVVGETQTAATVIESFTHVEVDAPLLATRAFAHDLSPPSREPLDASPAPSVASGSSRGVQVFSAVETSYATDNTLWLGAHVGACITLGPVCAAARLRIAHVVDGPGWDLENERKDVELLVGLDVPLRIRGLTLSPGAAAGLGHMHTSRGHDDRTDSGERTDTGGLRGEVHATLSIPLAHRFALDVLAAADVTQETPIDEGPTMTGLPDEPRLVLRLGLGLRYGGL